jgi:hypothetical protein
MNKIVDYEITQKTKSRLISDYHGFSNEMESAALRRLTKRWKEHPTVIACFHHCDAKASKAICDAGWEIAEYSNFNLIAELFDHKCQQTLTGQLRALQTKLRKWFAAGVFRYLIVEDQDQTAVAT